MLTPTWMSLRYEPNGGSIGQNALILQDSIWYITNIPTNIFRQKEVITLSFEVLVTNGIVVDGTGKARYQADIGIKIGKSQQ